MAKQILRELDTIDRCRMRLLTLRARVETNWPAGGNWLRRGSGLAAGLEATISAPLVAPPPPSPQETPAPPPPRPTRIENAVSHVSEIYRLSLASLTDLCELTMGAGYAAAGVADREAVFALSRSGEHTAELPSRQY